VSQKNELKPWQKSMWCIPPKHNAEFVCHMENVLEAYHRPYDPRFPLICMDELSKQLTIETHVPLPAQPGPARVLRLRIHSERHGQRLHLHRTSDRLATRGGHRPADEDRLGS
jgi:hypothetical protein